MLLFAGCAAGPHSIIIHETDREVVSVSFDPKAREGHSHPATLAVAQIAEVLRGVRVTKRDPLGFSAFGGGDAVAALTPPEIISLAPHLSEAFRKASPKDLVTFYFVTADRVQGRLITSGGMFVRGGRLYLILANAHMPLSSGPYEGTAYEMDNRDAPLQPLGRYKFTTGFVPAHAVIPHAELRGTEGHRPYANEANVVVLDLARLFPESKPAATVAPVLPLSR